MSLKPFTVCHIEGKIIGVSLFSFAEKAWWRKLLFCFPQIAIKVKKALEIESDAVDSSMNEPPVNTESNEAKSTSLI